MGRDGTGGEGQVSKVKNERALRGAVEGAGESQAQELRGLCGGGGGGGGGGRKDKEGKRKEQEVRKRDEDEDDGAHGGGTGARALLRKSRMYLVYNLV